MSFPTTLPPMTMLCPPLAAQSPSRPLSPGDRPSLHVVVRDRVQMLSCTARSRRVVPWVAGTVGSPRQGPMEQAKAEGST